MRSYLYKSQSAGVRDYLCNRLYGLPEREVERYLSQVGAAVSYTAVPCPAEQHLRLHALAGIPITGWHDCTACTAA